MKQNTKFDNGTWKTELRKISELKPNPKNPRTITKETIKPLRQSMRDNGVFAGYPMPTIHKSALNICKKIYDKHPYDGKIVWNTTKKELTICWSNTTTDQIKELIPTADKINPIGEWTGGTSVDTGITGRKLASDFYGVMKPLGGGTMHGKDLSKADCSVNIYLYMLAQQTRKECRAICSIGDKYVNVNGKQVKFDTIVKTARKYIKFIGGFEKFAEWGLQ